MCCEEWGGPAILLGVDSDRWPGCDNAAAFAACTWAHVYKPVTSRHYLHIVLHNDNCVPGAYKILQLALEAFNVRWMETGCGLVENVKRITALDTLKFRGQLDALGFASREFNSRLAETQIAEPYFLQNLKRAGKWGIFREENCRSVDSKDEHIGDTRDSIQHFELPASHFSEVGMISSDRGFG
jgi:hypothetical protein